MRGAYVLNVRGVKLAGLGAMVGAIDVFTTGLAAGATRLGAMRTEPFCTIGLIPCPEELWTPAEIAATKQIAENRICFINCSAN
jgi:hypothetical protein